MSIGICFLKGDILKSKSLDISSLKEHSELDILNLIASNCINLLWENNIKKEDVLGVGATILINNETYDGSNNSASELGHTIVKPYGDRCKCGKKGCLETVSSSKAIINKTQEIFSPDSTPILYKITDRDINNLSILNILTLYDPKEVILYGESFNNEFFIDIVKSYSVDFTNRDAYQK